MQFLVLVFLKRHTPPLLLVLLNYMRLFRLLRLMRFLKVRMVTCTAVFTTLQIWLITVST